MYRFVEHTAELELELEGASPEDVLLEGLRAFAELAGHAGDAVVERPVDIEAGDLPSLLAAWLDELVFLAETEGLVPLDAALSLDGMRLRAVVRAARGDPRPLVKGVTLHRLAFRNRGGRWQGRVVLDV
jgi:SHS2 domain-containing protein